MSEKAHQEENTGGPTKKKKRTRVELYFSLHEFMFWWTEAFEQYVLGVDGHSSEWTHRRMMLLAQKLNPDVHKHKNPHEDNNQLIISDETELLVLSPQPPPDILPPALLSPLAPELLEEPGGSTTIIQSMDETIDKDPKSVSMQPEAVEEEKESHPFSV
jgi:hypothetical protein